MGLEIQLYTLPVTTTGGAGVATGATTSELIRGALLDIFVDWNAAAPATSDITIAYGGIGGGNIWALINSSTDVLVAPRQKPVDNANAAITNAYDYFYLNNTVTVTVAQSDALAPAVTVYIKVARSFS